MNIEESTASCNGREGVGDAEEFVECCGYYAWYAFEGWISLQAAVDSSQVLAEQWGLASELGQDEVQRLMGDAFERGRAGWRAPWLKAIGRTTTAVAQAISPQHVPAATVKAFLLMVNLGNPDQLAAWLHEHSEHARDLYAVLEAA